MLSPSRFFTTIQRSLTDVSFYGALYKGERRSGIGYLASLLFVVWFVTIAFFAVTMGPAIPKAEPFLRTNLSIAQSIFPEDLVITIENAQLSTNKEGRVVVPFPEPWERVLSANDDRDEAPASLAVIDTTATVEDYAAADALLLITKTSIVAPDKDTGLRVLPLSDLDLPPGFVIDRPMIDDMASNVVEFLPSVTPILWGVLAFCVLLLPLFMMAFSLAGYLLWLLLPVLALWLFSYLRGFSFCFREIYHLSLFGLTPVVLISTAASLVAFPFGGWLSLGVFVLFMGYVLVQIGSKKPAAPAKAKTKAKPKGKAS